MDSNSSSNYSDVLADVSETSEENIGDSSKFETLSTIKPAEEHIIKKCNFEKSAGDTTIITDDTTSNNALLADIELAIRVNFEDGKSAVRTKQQIDNIKAKKIKYNDDKNFMFECISDKLLEKKLDLEIKKAKRMLAKLLGNQLSDSKEDIEQNRNENKERVDTNAPADIEPKDKKLFSDTETIQTNLSQDKEAGNKLVADLGTVDTNINPDKKTSTKPKRFNKYSKKRKETQKITPSKRFDDDDDDENFGIREYETPVFPDPGKKFIFGRTGNVLGDEMSEKLITALNDFAQKLEDFSNRESDLKACLPESEKYFGLEECYDKMNTDIGIYFTNVQNSFNEIIEPLEKFNENFEKHLLNTNNNLIQINLYSVMKASLLNDMEMITQAKTNIVKEIEKFRTIFKLLITDETKFQFQSNELKKIFKIYITEIFRKLSSIFNKLINKVLDDIDENHSNVTIFLEKKDNSLKNLSYEEILNKTTELDNYLFDVEGKLENVFDSTIQNPNDFDNELLYKIREEVDGKISQQNEIYKLCHRKHIEHAKVIFASSSDVIQTYNKFIVHAKDFLNLLLSYVETLLTLETTAIDVGRHNEDLNKQIIKNTEMKYDLKRAKLKLKELYKEACNILRSAKQNIEDDDEDEMQEIENNIRVCMSTLKWINSKLND